MLTSHPRILPRIRLTRLLHFSKNMKISSFSHSLTLQTKVHPLIYLLEIVPLTPLLPTVQLPMLLAMLPLLVSLLGTTQTLVSLLTSQQIIHLSPSTIDGLSGIERPINFILTANLESGKLQSMIHLMAITPTLDGKLLANGTGYIKME
jgi:hypothetical protein